MAPPIVPVLFHLTLMIPVFETLPLLNWCSYARARGLIEGGADIILIETIFDNLNAKAAIFAVKQVFAEDRIELPIMISGTHHRPVGTHPDRSTHRSFFIIHCAMPSQFWSEPCTGSKDLLVICMFYGEIYVSVHP